MPRPSSIDLLPPVVRDALNGWLRDPAITQTEATDRANLLIDAVNETKPEAEKVPHVNRHAVNRYDIKMREVGARLQQSRQIADVWIGKLGTEPEGKMGRLLNEMLRTLAFELTEKVMDSELSEETIPGVIEQIKNLSLTAMRLERSLNESVKTQKEIRKAFAEEAAAETESVAKEAGLTAEAVQTIKNKILGIA